MATNIPILSNDVLLLIFEQVSLADLKSLLNLCVVSRRFNDLATRLLYRSTSIPSYHFRNSLDIEHSRSQGKFLSKMIAYTRHLTMPSTRHPVQWSLLANVISRMKRLDSVRWCNWEEHFPAIIKDTLAKHWPISKLHIENLSIGTDTDNNALQEDSWALLQSLLESPNMHSLKAEIMYEHPVAMRWLKDVLLSSQNLEVLHITLPRDINGKADWECDGLGEYDLLVEPGEMLESLTKLVYETRFSFGNDRLTIPTSFFNWPNIRHLEIRGLCMHHFVRSLKDESLCLQTLIVEFFCLAQNYGETCQILETFLKNVSGLETLRLVNPTTKIPISTFTTYGKTLKSLTLQTPRLFLDPYQRFFPKPEPYSTEDLEELRLFCPFLSSLGLDLPIGVLLPYDILASISRFKSLTTLQFIIYFTAINEYSKYNKYPHIHNDTLMVDQICSYLSFHKSGLPFSQIDITIGDARFPPYNGNQPRVSRPDLLFSWVKGQVTMYDNQSKRRHPGWRFYFDPSHEHSNGPGAY